jgi:hypothetical protein
MSQTPPPPPIPSESSSSSSEEPASKPENPPTATPTTANPEKPNGHIDWTPDGFVGLSEAQRLRWQDMFSDLSIPDQIARAGAWLHANREERDAIENLGEGFHAFLIRWLLREDRGRPTHQGR